jgi:hypothetical protein
MFSNDDVLVGSGCTTLSLLPERTIGDETIQNQSSVISIIKICLQVLMLPPIQQQRAPGAYSIQVIQVIKAILESHGFSGRKNSHLLVSKQIFD